MRSDVAEVAYQQGEKVSGWVWDHALTGAIEVRDVEVVEGNEEGRSVPLLWVLPWGEMVRSVFPTKRAALEALAARYERRAARAEAKMRTVLRKLDAESPAEPIRKKCGDCFGFGAVPVGGPKASAVKCPTCKGEGRIDA